MDNTLGLLSTAEGLGRNLAAWLNRVKEGGHESQARELGVLIAMLLGIAQKEGPGGETLQQKWERFWEMVEPQGLGDSKIPRLVRPVVLDSAEWGFNIHLVIRPRRGVLTFAAYPAGEDSKALWSLSQLIQLGFVDRVRLCPNCRRFFFARRADSRLCSQPCRESAWRKTPKGRKARADYMRQYRKTMARLEEAKGYRRKVGRMIHLDLKKGK